MNNVSEIEADFRVVDGVPLLLLRLLRCSGIQLVLEISVISLLEQMLVKP